MPDIEKRLEAFVRIGHGIIVFPGGVGTAEEILYLLGILLHPDERRAAVPADLHRARRVGGVFRADRPVPAPRARRRGRAALPDHRRRSGARSRSRCARASSRCASTASTTRTRSSSTGRCTSRCEFQQPFVPTHEAMAALEPAPRPGSRTARGGPAPRVLRHRRRQRQGRRHARDRGARPVRDRRRRDIMQALDELLRASSRSSA